MANKPPSDKEIKAIEEVSKITGETYTDINQTAQQFLETAERAAQAAGKLQAIDKLRLDAIKNQLSLMKEIEIVEQRTKKEREGELRALEERAKYEADSVESARLELQIAERKHKQNLEDQTLSDKELENSRKAVENAREAVKQAEKEREVLKQNASIQDERMKKAKTFFDSITGGIAGKLLTPFTSFEGATSLISDTVNGIMQRQTDFAGVTGRMANQVGFDLNRVSDSYKMFGVTLEEQGKTYNEMFNSMSGFSKMNATLQKDLVGYTAAMKNFNISGDTVSKNYDILTKALKRTGDELKPFSEKLMSHAIAAGIAPKKMVEEFAAAAPKLAAYGKHAEDVYINLQKAAKSLGMEMQSLMGIVGDQFDTFEGSARAAGKLNAILGGNFLNSVEMLNATEDERIMLLKQSFDASGKQFDQLGKYEQKAIASSLGISDLAEANKLFGNSTTEVESDMKKQAVSQEKLSEAMVEATSVAKHLQVAFDRLADNEGIIKTAGSVKEDMAELSKNASAVAKVMNSLIGMMPYVVATIAIVGAGSFIYLGKKVSSVVKLFKSFSGGIGKLSENLSNLAPKTAPVGDGLNNMSNNMNKTGGAAGAAWKNMLGFGGAILLIGAGIGVAAWGLSKLVESFKGLTNATPALIAIGIVILGMVGAIALLAAMAPASALAALSILAIGAAMLALGGAVMLASIGMSIFVKAVGGLFDSIAKAGTGAMQLSVAFTSLLASLTLERVVNFVKFTSALEDLADAMEDLEDSSSGMKEFGKMTETINSLKLTNVDSFRYFIDSLGNMLKNNNIKSASDSIVASIEAISTSLDKMPEDKKLALKAMTSAISTTQTVTQQLLVPSQELKQIIEIQSKSRDVAEDKLIKALEAAADKIVKELKDGKTNPQPINLSITGEGGGSYENKLLRAVMERR